MRENQQLIAEAITSGDPVHRWTGVLLAGHFDRRDLSALLIRECEFSPLGVALRAVVLLCDWQAPQAARLLGNWAEDTRVIAPLRRFIIDSIKRLGSPRSLPSLVRVSRRVSTRWDRDDSTSQLAAHARQAFTFMVAEACRGSAAALASFVAQTLADRRNHNVEIVALLAEYAGGRLPLWFDLLGHFRWAVQEGVLEVLTEIGGPHVVEEMLSYLDKRTALCVAFCGGGRSGDNPARLG